VENDATGPQSVYGLEQAGWRGGNSCGRTGNLSYFVPVGCSVRAAAISLRPSCVWPVKKFLECRQPIRLAARPRRPDRHRQWPGTLGMLRQRSSDGGANTGFIIWLRLIRLAGMRFAKIIVEQAAAMPGFDLRLHTEAIRPFQVAAYPTPALRPMPIRGWTAPSVWNGF
jgi:hypothetical protein